LPAVLPLIVVPAAAPARIVKLGSQVAPAKEAEEAAVVTACDADIGRARACHETPLRLVVQRNNELCAIVGLFVQGLIRDDERGSRPCGWRNAIEHILRDGDAVERGLAVVPAVGRDLSVAFCFASAARALAWFVPAASLLSAAASSAPA
jgi:hypothetical protein